MEERLTTLNGLERRENERKSKTGPLDHALGHTKVPSCILLVREMAPVMLVAELAA